MRKKILMLCLTLSSQAYGAAIKKAYNAIRGRNENVDLVKSAEAKAAKEAAEQNTVQMRNKTSKVTSAVKSAANRVSSFLGIGKISRSADLAEDAGRETMVKKPNSDLIKQENPPLIPSRSPSLKEKARQLQQHFDPITHAKNQSAAKQNFEAPVVTSPVKSQINSIVIPKKQAGGAVTYSSKLGSKNDEELELEFHDVMDKKPEDLKKRGYSNDDVNLLISRNATSAGFAKNLAQAYPEAISQDTMRLLFKKNESNPHYTTILKDLPDSMYAWPKEDINAPANQSKLREYLSKPGVVKDDAFLNKISNENIGNITKFYGSEPEGLQKRYGLMDLFKPRMDKDANLKKDVLNDAWSDVSYVNSDAEKNQFLSKYIAPQSGDSQFMKSFLQESNTRELTYLRDNKKTLDLSKSLSDADLKDLIAAKSKQPESRQVLQDIYGARLSQQPQKVGAALSPEQIKVKKTVENIRFNDFKTLDESIATAKAQLAKQANRSAVKAAGKAKAAARAKEAETAQPRMLSEVAHQETAAFKSVSDELVVLGKKYENSTSKIERIQLRKKMGEVLKNPGMTANERAQFDQWDSLINLKETPAFKSVSDELVVLGKQYENSTSRIEKIQLRKKMGEVLKNPDMTVNERAEFDRWDSLINPKKPSDSMENNPFAESASVVTSKQSSGVGASTAPSLADQLAAVKLRQTPKDLPARSVSVSATELEKSAFQRILDGESPDDLPQPPADWINPKSVTGASVPSGIPVAPPLPPSGSVSGIPTPPALPSSTVVGGSAGFVKTPQPGALSLPPATDERSALLNDIQRGAKLKNVADRSSGPTDARSQLLNQIKVGKPLRKVADSGAASDGKNVTSKSSNEQLPKSDAPSVGASAVQTGIGRGLNTLLDSKKLKPEDHKEMLKNDLDNIEDPIKRDEMIKAYNTQNGTKFTSKDFPVEQWE